MFGHLFENAPLHILTLFCFYYNDNKLLRTNSYTGCVYRLFARTTNFSTQSDSRSHRSHRKQLDAEQTWPYPDRCNLDVRHTSGHTTGKSQNLACALWRGCTRRNDLVQSQRADRSSGQTCSDSTFYCDNSICTSQISSD